MKEIAVFSVDFTDESGPNHVGLFGTDDIAKHVSKGNGAYDQDANVTPQIIKVFESVEEFTAETGKRVLSHKEIQERLKKSALEKLTEEEKKALGY